MNCVIQLYMVGEIWFGYLVLVSLGTLNLRHFEGSAIHTCVFVSFAVPLQLIFSPQFI